MPGTIDMKNKMQDMITKRNVVVPEKIRNKSAIQKKIKNRCDNKSKSDKFLFSEFCSATVQSFMLI